MSASRLTIWLNDELKSGAAEVAAYYELDLPSVMHAFCKQMVNTHRIPLTFAPEGPNAESLEAIADGDAFLASGKPGRFTNGARPHRGSDGLTGRLADYSA